MVSQELKLSDQLFGLYVDVLETLAEWKHVSPCKHTLRPKAARARSTKSRVEQHLDKTFSAVLYYNMLR